MVKIKDVGDLHWLLGIEVECDHRLCTVFFSQCAYILYLEDPQLIQLTECESIEHPTWPPLQAISIIVPFHVSSIWWHIERLLSSRDPRLIAEIPSDPRLMPYRSSNSIPTILQDSNTMLTKTLNSKYLPSDTLLSLSELRMTSENPDHISVFICLHRSILVLLNSEFIFMSLS